MDHETRMRMSRRMTGNTHAVGHGGRKRRTERHYLAPHTVRAPIELDRILDRMRAIECKRPR